MKSKHRKASKAKRAALVLMPKWWLPKMEASQKLDTKIIHSDNLTPMTNGTATLEDLMDWMESAYTYTEVIRILRAEDMVLTDEQVAPIAAQMAIHDQIMTRYEKTGRIGFSGLEYSIARAAAELMDNLSELEFNGSHARAVIASEPKKAAIRARMKRAQAEGVAA